MKISNLNFTEDIGDKENFSILRELATNGAETFLQLEKSTVRMFPGSGWLQELQFLLNSSIFSSQTIAKRVT
jgi:hypothetical protein